MNTTGLIVKVSKNSFEHTYKTLKTTIENNPNLKILLALDHQANAEKNGLTLNPTRIIVFGNPKLGTLLIQSNQHVGLDLPQKIVIQKNLEGVVEVLYNDPAYLKERHGLTGVDEVLAKITKALDTITELAIA